MITKERMDEALKLLKNDPKYYVKAKSSEELVAHWNELCNEIDTLDEYVTALKSFAKIIEKNIREKALNNLKQQ